MLRILLVLGAVAAALVPTPPLLVERTYSQGLYPVIQGVLTPASNRIGFALLDVLAAAVAAGLIGAFAVDMWRRRLGHFGWLGVMGRGVARLAVAVATLYLAFLAVWGLNYRRIPLAEKLQIDRSRISPRAARELAALTIARLNELDKPAHASLAGRGETLNGRLADGFARTQRELGASRTAAIGLPKPTLFDLYLRRAAVDGMTDPYFLETLVVQDLLPFEEPFVIAHEWAHLAGYADESEANFVGWLTAVRAGEAPAYSGWLFLYGELVGQLDPDDRRTLPPLAAGPQADRRAIVERYRRNVSPRLATAGWTIYDRYLKANRVEAGAASYAAVVQLVLGARFGPEWTPLLKGGG
jgi:Protein of unknown function (DUF3810)